MLLQVVLLAACAVASAQVAAPIFTAVAGGDGFLTVNFIANDTGTPASSFLLQTIPLALFPATPPSFTYGSLTGPNEICAATDTTCAAVDATRWFARVNWGSGNPCPFACPMRASYAACSGVFPSYGGIGQYGGACASSAGAGSGSFITPSFYGSSTTRGASLMAFNGAMINVQNFWRAPSTYDIAFGAMNGVPVLAPVQAIPMNIQTRINFHIVDWVGITYNWDRYSMSGLLLFDMDNLNRMRPIFSYGLYEYFGQWQANYVTCTGSPRVATSTCTMPNTGGAISIGGSSTPTPSVAAPWQYIMDRNPFLGTWAARPIHPSIGQWTGPTWNDNNMPSLMGSYWTNYLNNATFGGFSPANLRVGYFTETSGGAGDSQWGATVSRVYMVESPVASNLVARLLGGNNTRPAATMAVNNALASTMLDASRFSFYGPTVGNSATYCPYNGVGKQCLVSANVPVQTVSNGVAQMLVFYGADMHTGGPAAFLSTLSTTNPGPLNGASLLGYTGAYPTDEPYRISFDINALTSNTPFDWNRNSFSGLMVYILDAQGRVAPIWFSGLYEWLGQFQSYFMQCGSSSSCNWVGTGSAISIGGSSTVLPTAAVPWTYAVDRNPFAGTWQPRHSHPNIGTWNDASTIYLDGNIPNNAIAYYTAYLNNPLYAAGGAFNAANLRVGVFVSAISGGSTGIQNAYGFNVARMYITSTVEASLLANQATYAAIKATSDSLTACGIDAPASVNVTRASSCVGTACSVRVPLSANGVNSTVTILAAAGGLLSPVVAPAAVAMGKPTLPVAGAQLFLDANSMASWTGATGAGALPCVGPGSGSSPGSGVVGTCRPTVWWPDVSGSNYLFGQSLAPTYRPYLKSWSPVSPYQSLVFDGTDDHVQLDISMVGRDPEFNLQFPDQTGYVPARDAETTWFMLYQPSDITATGGARTAFGKGSPITAAGSAYQYYSQRAVSTGGSNFNQWQGFAVSGIAGPQSAVPSGLATTVANRFISNSPSLTGNAHSVAPTLITLTHYRNNSFNPGVLTARTYVMNACVGIQTGNFMTDACSDGFGTSPADPWSASANMGLLLLRQVALDSIAGVPAGVTNIVDYGQPGTSMQAPTPMAPANAMFSVGTAGFISSPFRGQMLALVMYRKSLTRAERESVQTYLLGRYNQLCPAISAPPGAANGCAQSASGVSCIILCNAGRTAATGTNTVTCRSGQWIGKMPTCVASCPSRSSPRDYATCSQTYSSYDFTSATAYPVPTSLSSIGALETIIPAAAPYSLTDAAWGVRTPAGFSNGMLVGSPVIPVGCSPIASGPLTLGENAPAYLLKLAPAGATMIVEASLRLLVPGTQVGISLRSSATSSMRVILGQPTVGANGAIMLQKTVNGITTNVVTSSTSDWDQSGSPSASPIRLRLSAIRVNPADTTMAQNIFVDLVSPSGATTRLITYADTILPLTTGAPALIVLSGMAGFEFFSVSGICDNSGSSCQLRAGQSCSWTCSPGTLPAVNQIPYAQAYSEMCDASGSLPGPAAQFSCIPLPPTFPTATFSIFEDAPVSTILGSMNATTLNPKHVVLYSIAAGAAFNTARLYDAYGALDPAASIITDVFAVNSCSGQMYLNRGGVLNWNYGAKSFSITVTGCTNGILASCATQNFTVIVRNVPTPPLFYMDSDSTPSLFSPWVRTIPENSRVGTPLWRWDGSSVSSLNVTAVSLEGNPLAYDIPYGNVAGVFAIDPVYGRITVVKPLVTGCVGACPSVLNFEAEDTFSIIVRATDTVTAKFGTVQLQISVLDRNDPLVANVAAGGATQYLTISEESAQLANADCGALVIDDEDTLQPTTRSWGVEVHNASFVGLAPQLVVNSTGTTVRLQLRTGITYPPIASSPILSWRNLNVRGVISAVVRVQDRGGATVTINVQVGIVSTFNPGNEPVAAGVLMPLQPRTGLPGFNTSGNQRFTISGQNFMTINTTYGGLVFASVNSQVGDAFPNRSYPCTGCVVMNDAVISCASPAGWGDHLVLALTYGPARRNMAAQAPLPVKYLAPRVNMIMGSGHFPPTETAIAGRALMSTDGGELLILVAWDLGLRADAARTVSVEYGMPVPGTDIMDSDGMWSRSLEYKAPYVPCRSTINTTYEVWATPSNPRGFAGVVSGVLTDYGCSRVCFMTAPGIGTTLQYQVRVGNRVSAISNQTDFPGTGWWLGYRPPVLSRMWLAPVNLRSDVPGNWVGPPRWDLAAACCTVNPLGGDLVYVNGTNFGPMDKMPMVHFYVGGRMMYIDGLATLKNVNYSVGLTPAGIPNCFKPDPTRASSLMACATPPGTGQGLRMRLQLGNQAFTGNLYQHSYVYPRPVLTAVAGPGVVNGGTEGRQLLVLTGSNFGPLPINYQKSITNPYVTPRVPMVNTYLTNPITVWYGISSPWNQYVAQSCVVTSEAPNQVSCLTVPGVGVGFTYIINVGGNSNVSLRVATNGYAPPLVSSVQRVAADLVVDPSLGGVPGVTDYKTAGGEFILINGRNFGPCPGSGLAPCAMTQGGFSVTYNVKLDDATTRYNSTVTAFANKTITYTATNCIMTVEHFQLQCQVAPGAGSNAVVRVMVGGQSSVLPTTSYASPEVTGLSILGGAATASTNGGDTLAIAGANFGPRGATCGATNCRGLIQSITYGPTGTEFSVKDWNLPSAAAVSHDMIHAVLNAGVGSNLQVIISIADRASQPSVVTFSYAPPTVLAMTPSTGPTRPNPLVPVFVTLSGRNFGTLNPNSVLSVVFGNTQDRTQNSNVAVVSVYPNIANAAQVAAFLALSAATREERITFRLPPGAGPQRLVQVVVQDSNPNSAPVSSAPVFFDYATPAIMTVVVQALQQFVDNNASGALTPEYIAAQRAFGSTDDLALARRLIISGTNFGDPIGAVAQLVEWADASTTTPLDSSTVWTSSATSAMMTIVSWTDSFVVVVTPVTSAWVRLRIVAESATPTLDTVSGLPLSTPVATASSPYQFNDLSPSIGNLVGSQGPFATVGGDIVSFTVQNLASTIALVSATVNGAPCPLVYSPEDTQRRAGGVAPFLVPAGSVRSELIFNSDSKFAYFDTATVTTSSMWTLYCQMPAGQGSAANLIIARDTQISGSLSLRYRAPSVTSIAVVDLVTGTAGAPMVYVPGQTKVSISTIGAVVRVTGTNFGLCPGVIAGANTPIYADLPGCGAYSVQTGATGSQTAVDVRVPEGEGTGFAFNVVVEDQLSMETIAFEYAAPSITSMTPGGRTAGGDSIQINGTNFGVMGPTVTIGGLGCSPVSRAVGLAGHYSVTCTLTESSGKGLDVVLTVAGTQSVTLVRGFSYFPPVITQVLLGSTFSSFDLTLPSFTWVSGPSAGGFQVVLVGDNFGPEDTTGLVNCLFVAWRGRDASKALRCNAQQDFVGEGEIPYFALTEYANYWSHTMVSFLFPPGYGVKDIIVSINGNVPVSPPVFRYDAPVITSELRPNHGPTAGGTKLFLEGVNFGIPVIDTSDAAQRALLPGVVIATSPITYVPVALTRAEYVNPAAIVPMAALAISFGRGCVTNYLTAAGLTPSFLSSCDAVRPANPRISEQTQTLLSFASAGGIGVNRSVTVTVYDQQPSATIPGVMELVTITSNAVYWAYDPPQAVLTTSRPVLMDDAADIAFTVSGVNFGSLEQSVAQQWTAAELAVNLTVDGVPAIAASRGVSNANPAVKVDQLLVKLPVMTVGYHNMSYLVATQQGYTGAAPASKATLLLACEGGVVTNYLTAEMGPNGGFFGRPGEMCRSCPVGAVCPGFDVSRGPRSVLDPGVHVYPVPVPGFYNLNSSDRLTSGMYSACPDNVVGQNPGRDVCIVKCEPPEACLGDNVCAPEYRSVAPMFRCATCSPGFYKRATSCVKCPDSPWALVIGFLALVAVGGGVAYALNRYKINIAYVAIAIDYFQVLAIFAMSKVAWPAAIQELFHVLSAFNLNIEIVAPECIVPDLGFQRKWSFVMALPLSLQVFFGLLTLLFAGYNKLIKNQKVRLVDLGGSMMSSVLMVMFIMYIYLTRNILDVFNCAPTDPPDGKTYMSAVFEECGKPGGVQLTLVPAAVIAVIVYILGYPAGVGYLLWTNRETVMEDQLLRAKGVGDDKLTNPNAYAFRERWSRLYYQFRPDAVLWILVIILRKFCIAATFILFNTQPSFQLAAVFLVIFLSYSAQMRFAPYQSPQDFDAILKDHEVRSFSDPVHARLRATLSGIATRTKRTARTTVMSAEGTVDASALLGVLRGWLFNYNTVEQLLLFSAGIVAVMGMMFAAQNKKAQYYKESRDATTSVVIAVVAISIVYLAVVFVTEVMVLTGESNRRKAALSSKKKEGSDGMGSSGGSKRVASGEVFDAGDVSQSTNPMMLGKKAAVDAIGSDLRSTDEDAEALQALANMREPPTSVEMWYAYKDKYESLAANVELLRAQVNAAPAHLRSDGGVPADE